MCNRITSSGHANSHFSASLPRPASDQVMVKTTHHCSPSPETHSAGLHCRTPTRSRSFQINTARISAIHESHLSSHHSIHSPGRKCDLSPQRREERKGSQVWRSRNISTITALTPALSPHDDAGSYSSNRNGHSVSTTGKSKTQNSATVPVEVV